MADLATKDQDRPPTLSMTPDKLEPLSQAQMDAVDTSDGRSKQPLAGGGVLPRGSSPTEQALGLDSQTSAYGVKARQLQQDQLNATRTANAAGDARNERYMRMMEDQYKATGLQPGELPKWDAKKEREQFQTDPIQAFGSMASVFGILASAFTHAPLTNALNASSAAMNAIRQGDEKGYNEAFDAWKENTLLTYKRHEVEQQRFNDATRLLDTNWKLGEAKMRATAVEFGMQSELAMMDSGMWPELFKLQQSKMDAAAGMLRASDTLTNERFKNDLFKQWESAADEEFKGDPNKQAGARLSFAMARNAINSSSPEWQTIGNQVGQWQAQVMHNEKRIPTTEEVSAKIRELKEATSGRLGARENLDQEWLRSWKAEHKDATPGEEADAINEHIASKRAPTLSADDAAERARKIAAGKQTGINETKPPSETSKLTVDRQISTMMADKKKALITDGVPEEDANKLATSYAAEMRARATPIPANRADDLRRLASMDNRAIDEIDTLDRMMKQNSAITGALGRARRAGESLTGLFGGNADQAKLFRERLITLRHWVSQLIDNRVTAGRPLSSQEAQITAMVPGLDLGDNPHYVRDALADLRKTLANMSKENQERIGKSFAPGAPPPKGGARSGVPLWQRGSPVGDQNGAP